jgi:hypothetical protein
VPRVKTPRSTGSPKCWQERKTRMPDTGIVARQDHHLHARFAAGIEGQQLVHQREGHARPCRLLQPLQLQLHVGMVVGGLEDAVLLLEIEQRA